MTAPPIGTGSALFDTALGRCGIAWTPRGIAAVQLPESTDERTRARLRRRLSDAPEASSPPAVRQVTSRIVALLAGNEVDLSDIRLDMDGIAPFHHAVYAAARTIPAGVTITYGALASRIGAPGAARSVGQALGRNPFAVIVPCHRIVASGGKIGGFSAGGGASTKLDILAVEGALLPLPMPMPPARGPGGPR